MGTYDDEKTPSAHGEETGVLEVLIPPRAELHVKHANFFSLAREEKNRLEREHPEVFRNGVYGIVIEAGESGKKAGLDINTVGTAVLVLLNSDGSVASSEQIFP